MDCCCHIDCTFSVGMVDNVRRYKMIYLEYEIFKSKYLDTQRTYNEILEEQERLFTKTQPNAIRYDKERVQGGYSVNSLEEYMMEKEKKHIDDRLKESRQLLNDRATLLKAKEKELRESQDKIDRIYVCKYLDGMHPDKIAMALNYSKSQVYRILKRIQSKK